jgi:membrane-associated phospholipid phosphatase
MATSGIKSLRALDVIVRKDGALLDYVCAHRSDLLNPVMLAATWSSSLAVYLGIAVVGSLAGGTIGQMLLSAAAAAGLASAIAYVPKRLVARPRPTRTCPLRQAMLKDPDSWSFPSSHTATAFAAAVAIGAQLGPGALVCALVWAAVVGISRVYVAVHYPLDVVMGALLGTCVSVGLGGLRDGIAANLAALI